MKSERDDIDEMFEPAFLVEADSGVIERANAQALKFLKKRRVDIKDKIFPSFILPQIKVSDLNKLFSKYHEKLEEFPLFFRTRIGEEDIFQCRTITLTPKMMNNRRYFIICAQKRSYNNNSVEILINERN